MGPLIDGGDNDDDSVTRKIGENLPIDCVDNDDDDAFIISKIFDADDDGNDVNSVDNFDNNGGIPIISRIVDNGDGVRSIYDDNGNDDHLIVNMIIDADEDNPGPYDGSFGDVFVVTDANYNDNEKFSNSENGGDDAKGSHIHDHALRPCYGFTDEISNFTDGNKNGDNDGNKNLSLHYKGNCTFIIGSSDEDDEDPDANEFGTFQAGDDGEIGNFASTIDADIPSISDGSEGGFATSEDDGDLYGRFDIDADKFGAFEVGGDSENGDFASAEVEKGTAL